MKQEKQSTEQIESLKDAMNVLSKLKVPDHLQDTALKHLLAVHGRTQGSTVSDLSTDHLAMGKIKPSSSNLREFAATFLKKGAVNEIPALVYWAKTQEGKEDVGEREIVELYRRANIRPPKAIAQSFRDLSSRKYLRLESVEGKKGYFRLSRTGEDYVLYDVLGSGT